MSQQRPSLGERLKEALQEGIRHNKGEIKLRVTEIEVPEPPRRYTATDVLQLRQDLHLSQAAFAALLHVAVKTVQSWEQGERNPSQAAARLLQVIEQPNLLADFVRTHR